MTYKDALNTCAADGASLPKLITAEDFLAVTHYINDNSYAWSSLLKVDNNVNCDGIGCDGLLEWLDGSTFTFADSALKGSVSPGSGTNCIEIGLPGKLILC